MRKAKKALLLSALVFPGSGHFFLKKYTGGSILAGLSIICFYILITNSIEIAQAISAKIATGEILLEVNELEDALSKERHARSGLLNPLSYLLGICWVVGIIDSFRVGRQQESLDKIED